MTERKISNNARIFGTVVDINDPLKSGRVRIRWFGIHDDEKQIPDKDLPWAHPAAGISSASLNHVGMSPTGVMAGSTVYGESVDRDKQIYVYSGSLPRAEIKKEGKGEKKQPKSPDEKSDVAPNARGTEKTGVKGETNFGDDISSPLEASIINKAADADTAKKDEAVKYKKMKHEEKKSVGSSEFKDGQNILNLIKSIDGENGSGAIQSSLQGMFQLKNLISGGSSMGGSEGLGSMMDSFSKNGNMNVSQFMQQFIQGDTHAGENTNNNQNQNQAQQFQSQNMRGFDVNQILNQVINEFISQISGFNGQKGGLKSFDKEHNVLAGIEEAHKKIFSKLS